MAPHRVEAEVTIPEQMPSPALDAFLFTPATGTLFLGNAFFVEGAGTGPVADELKTKAPEELAPDLGFSFPYQPNIMESIRNLLWHVPMWFAMFFVMGIGFVASLMLLWTDHIEWDQRGEAAVRTGLVFGLLGLATGSLWARWTWGAGGSRPPAQWSPRDRAVYTGYLILRAAMGDDERVAASLPSTTSSPS